MIEGLMILLSTWKQYISQQHLNLSSQKHFSIVHDISSLQANILRGKSSWNPSSHKQTFSAVRYPKPWLGKMTWNCNVWAGSFVSQIVLLVRFRPSQLKGKHEMCRQWKKHIWEVQPWINHIREHLDEQIQQSPLGKREDALDWGLRAGWRWGCRERAPAGRAARGAHAGSLGVHRSREDRRSSRGMRRWQAD